MRSLSHPRILTKPSQKQPAELHLHFILLFQIRTPTVALLSRFPLPYPPLLPADSLPLQSRSPQLQLLPLPLSVLQRSSPGSTTNCQNLSARFPPKRAEAPSPPRPISRPCYPKPQVKACCPCEEDHPILPLSPLFLQAAEHSTPNYSKKSHFLHPSSSTTQPQPTHPSARLLTCTFSSPLISNQLSTPFQAAQPSPLQSPVPD